MKVVERGIMKVLPGKMTEAMELNQKHIAIASRLGMPLPKSYRCLSGRGEFMHTLVFEVEWDSFAAMEAVNDKMSADPEVQALMVKWDAVIDSHEIEFYTPLS